TGLLQQVRVVLLLPDEDQVRGGHELRDELTARSRTRKRIRPDAPPPVAIGAVVAEPELLLRDVCLLEDELALLHPARQGSRARSRRLKKIWPRPGQAGGAPRSRPEAAPARRPSGSGLSQGSRSRS